MSDSDPGFKEYCKALMADYKSWIDEKHPQQDVSREHPIVYIESEKIGILCQWEPPNTVTEKWTKFNGLDEGLIGSLTNLASEHGVLYHFETEQNVVFRFVKCKSISTCSKVVGSNV